MDGNFRIGQWLVQPQLNLIQGPSGDTSVEPKAMEVLVCLSQQAGEVVPKERLMQTVWADTFVTDEVLTNSIWELRKAFHDDAKNPKVIQTVFKKGYRLIASVSFEGKATELGLSRPPFGQGGTSGGSRRKWISGVIAVALLVAAAAVGLRTSRNVPSAPALPPNVVPLTSLPGSEIQPALSPDGNQVAFAWSRPKEENYDIYLKVIGSESLLRLSADPSNELSPAWSADGRRIAFLRLSKSDQTIVIVPALGGSERVLYSSKLAPRPGRGQTRFRGRTLSWSPDGQLLAVAESLIESRDQVIVVSVETGEKRTLFSPSRDFVFKFPSLSFSPDGSLLAFASSLGSNVVDIYLFPFPAGEPRRLTFNNSPIDGLDWTTDGQAIIFSRRDTRGFHLWRVSLSGGEPQLLTWSGDGALFPSLSRRRNSLAYVQNADDLNIWRLDLAESPALQVRSTPVVSSTRLDANPKFSPDGKRMLFTSSRSGTDEIWICNSDGSDPLQLTSLRCPRYRQSTLVPGWSGDCVRHGPGRPPRYLRCDRRWRQGHAAHAGKVSGCEAKLVEGWALDLLRLQPKRGVSGVESAILRWGSCAGDEAGRSGGAGSA